MMKKFLFVYLLFIGTIPFEVTGLEISYWSIIRRKPCVYVYIYVFYHISIIG